MSVGVAALSGASSAAQALINGRLGEHLGSPVTAAMVSNGLATVILLIATAASRSVRDGLRRVWRHRLSWWCYLGGSLGALSVAGTALAAPVLGVALFTLVQVCGLSMGGMVTDGVGLGPTGRVPVSAPRLAGAGLAVVAVAVAELGQPIGHVALGMLAFVFVLGAGRATQSALNGRVGTVALNVGAASLVNAVVGTTVLGLAGGLFAAADRLPFHGWPGSWWEYTGGALALVVTGAILIAVRSIGVLRTGLAALAGQLVGALVLDAMVPGEPRPTGWLVLGSALIALAVLLSGAATRRVRQR